MCRKKNWSSCAGLRKTDFVSFVSFVSRAILWEINGFVPGCLADFYVIQHLKVCVSLILLIYNLLTADFFLFLCAE